MESELQLSFYVSACNSSYCKSIFSMHGPVHKAKIIQNHPSANALLVTDGNGSWRLRPAAKQPGDLRQVCLPQDQPRSGGVCL